MNKGFILKTSKARKSKRKYEITLLDKILIMKKKKAEAKIPTKDLPYPNT